MAIRVKKTITMISHCKAMLYLKVVGGCQKYKCKYFFLNDSILFLYSSIRRTPIVAFL